MEKLIRNILIIGSIGLLCGPLQVSAEEVSKAFMHEYESGSIVYTDKKTSLQRSAVTFSTERILQDGRVIYKYTAHGKGDYDEYKNVLWDIEACMEEKNNLLYPVYSIGSFKDKDGRIIVKHEKRFDYDKQKIYYTVSNFEGKIIKNILFPMKGITVDSATLTDFLKIFAAHRNEKSYKIFYLLSDKAELYKINIKDLGIEALEIPEGKINAIKLRLVPDLGLLTGIAKSLIPPTFIWYSEQAPYEWLQYEGLETGIGSAHVIIRKFTK